MRCHECGAVTERGPVTIEEAEERFELAATHEQVSEALKWSQRHAKSLFGQHYDPKHPNRARVVRALNAAIARVNGS
jgi:hypothetical protein